MTFGASRKEREEEIALEAFLAAYGEPHGAPDLGRPGIEPDFLLSISDRRVGIEVTNDVWRARRHVEESRAEVVRRARDIYMSRKSIPIDVAIHWADDAVQGDRAQTAEKIAAAVEGMVPGQAEGMHEAEDYRLYDLGLPQLFRIGVHRHPSIRRGNWYSPDAGSVRVLGENEIRAVIEKKEKRHQAFLDRSEGWLLIYTFDERISGSSDIDDDARQASYRAKFSKVFALNVPRKELIEFRVDRPSSDEPVLPPPSS